MQINGVTIYTSDNNVGLKNILQIVGQAGLDSNWRIFDAEFISDAADRLHEISDSDLDISGSEFYDNVSITSQTIDGVFEAFKSNETSYWLLIRAVDGTEFDIETQDLELLERIRYSFDNVKDLIY